jgi:cell fate regulator YaaT (PSP1 superfamily)
MAELGNAAGLSGSWIPPASLDKARAVARERFKTRIQSGEQIGACGCGDEDEIVGVDDGSPRVCVVGVRFRDSGRVYYFRSSDGELDVGDWIVVNTARGEEAARVVIAPHHVRGTTLQGDLSSVVRRLDETDIGRMEAYRQRGATAIRTFGLRARERHLGIKPIAADYTFNGTQLNLSYSVPDRERAPESGALRELARDLATELTCRVELRQVGPRDEARLLGGLGRCGRTLCCSSWLPVFPEISMSMAKNQDLPLNPAKVSGVCGRLLCCLSYENDQYRQMKAVMPKLGQTIETPAGAGQVLSIQLLKELVTVRITADDSEATFRSDELGLGSVPGVPDSAAAAPVVEPDSPGVVPEPDEVDDATAAPLDGSGNSPGRPTRRRRRRRTGRRGAGSGRGD